MEDEKKTGAQEDKKNFGRIKRAVISAVDANGNGQLDVEDIIIGAIRVPGVKIDRASYLRHQLHTRFPEDVIELAVAENPRIAGIPLEIIDELADEAIKYERTIVSGISAALSIPGGWAIVATLPVDIAQYYGCMLRVAQKLLYLYGFPQIDMEEKDAILDDTTLNVLVACFAVMNGVAGANSALRGIAAALGRGVSRQLKAARLSQNAFYNAIKATLRKYFEKKINKTIFAGFFEKAIPVVGGIIGGGLTYLSFKPCCDKLKAVLRDTILSNPDYKPGDEIDIIDIAADEAED